MFLYENVLNYVDQVMSVIHLMIPVGIIFWGDSYLIQSGSILLLNLQRMLLLRINFYGMFNKMLYVQNICFIGSFA